MDLRGDIEPDTCSAFHDLPDRIRSKWALAVIALAQDEPIRFAAYDAVPRS
jgi:DNA-binding HxlR family transcriptional regulator